MKVHRIVTCPIRIGGDPCPCDNDQNSLGALADSGYSNVIAFNPAAGTLTLRRKPGFITFYPDKVMITQVKDSVEGLEVNHLL